MRGRKIKRMVPLRIMVTPEQHDYIIGLTRNGEVSMGYVIRQLINPEMRKEETNEGRTD